MDRTPPLKAGVRRVPLNESNNSQMKLILTICLCLYAACLLSSCSNNKPFNSETWLKGDMRVRGQMVHSLKDGRILEGKSRQEVITLLGKPESEYSDVLVYQVDLGHKFVSSPWLYQMNVVIESGKVARVSLTD